MDGRLDHLQPAVFPGSGLVLGQGALSSLQSRLCASLEPQAYFLFPHIDFLAFSSAASLCVKLGLCISPVNADMH